MILHTCCAPCALKCVEALRAEGIEPTLLWDNFNIHPYTEYNSRLESLKRFAEDEKLELIIGGGYGLRGFLNGTPDKPERCGRCYRARLQNAARYGAFSTTLLISPYQNHELLREIGESLGNFVYRDFRPLFREGQRLARERGFYMQKYCGCIFSEEERYVQAVR